jgi:hypothetical protein
LPELEGRNGFLRFVDNRFLAGYGRQFLYGTVNNLDVLNSFANPMLMTIFSILGTCIGFLYLNSFTSAGATVFE